MAAISAVSAAISAGLGEGLGEGGVEIESGGVMKIWPFVASTVGLMENAGGRCERSSVRARVETYSEVNPNNNFIHFYDNTKDRVFESAPFRRTSFVHLPIKRVSCILAAFSAVFAAIFGEAKVGWK